METQLFRVRTNDNPSLSDDEVVAECMAMLMEKHPQVVGYQFERDGDSLLILMWGSFDTSTESNK